MSSRDYLGEHIIPHLTEPGVKYYMTETLKICNVSKHKYFNIIFNVTTFVGLGMVVAGILYYRYKGLPSQEEKRKKSNQKKTYILGKIQAMQKMQQNNSLDLITNLAIK
tara:strand:+ start:297 stop:623 length:327 start_codon:yes stop_codon:yes gene_type:complete